LSFHFSKIDYNYFDPIFQPMRDRMRVARKIFAILRRVGSFLAKRTGANHPGSASVDLKDRRGTRRVSVHIPVFVYGRTQGGDPFYEETYTILVNGYGGLISMSSPVRPGQQLAVTNQGNDRTEQCVVVSIEASATDRSNIALRFPTSMPQFWRGLEIGKCPGI
jgi:hypothetical protein